MNINPFVHGSTIHTEVMKTQALRQALDEHAFDAAFGGARRDEEKSRAKERIFSFRSAQHHWDPKNQRPELWRTYNCRKHQRESIRVFPLSNWTELDVWQYVHSEDIPSCRCILRGSDRWSSATEDSSWSTTIAWRLVSTRSPSCGRCDSERSAAIP
jgi:3'-phosphoadenosine 5'-phosphosulfate sulfotransferase (PAPS reductase)/FAD synthetase